MSRDHMTNPRRVARVIKDLAELAGDNDVAEFAGAAEDFIAKHEGAAGELVGDGRDLVDRLSKMDRPDLFGFSDDEAPRAETKTTGICTRCKSRWPADADACPWCGCESQLLDDEP